MIVTFPNSPYELHQPFEPAGDQPEAIEKLVQGLNDGLSFQTLLGVTGSGPAASAAYSHTGSLYDVVAGANGSCGGTYLCNAGPGYDGPTGMGTPNGTAAFVAA